MLKNIVKRDGRIALYDESKIARRNFKGDGRIERRQSRPMRRGLPKRSAGSSKNGSPTGFRRWRRFRTRWKSP